MFNTIIMDMEEKKEVYEKPVCEVILIEEEPVMMKFSTEATMDNLEDGGEVPVDEYDE